MSWQKENEGSSCWPIFDAQKNDYITPKVTVVETYPSSGRSTPNNVYFRDILSTARCYTDSEEYRILEALTPYAAWLKRDCGDATYDRIRELIPEYPEFPV